MGYKDPEKQKEKMREQMRQRRAQAKAQKAGDNLPLAAPGAISPPDISGKTSLEPSTPAPVTSPEYQVDWKKRKSEPRPQPLSNNDPAKNLGIVTDSPRGGYWTRFPGQDGRPCFNDARYSCCYDLNFPVPWERHYCTGHPEYPCGYSKPISLFDMAGVK
ncbi:MAG: hypothetical protein V1653_01880 [bacterium]